MADKKKIEGELSEEELDKVAGGVDVDASVKTDFGMKLKNNEYSIAGRGNADDLQGGMGTGTLVRGTKNPGSAMESQKSNLKH